MAFDVTIKYQPSSGRQRVVLKDGEPVPDDSLAHEMVSLLCESPGWAMEETPRKGNLARAFQEYTSGTPSRFKAAVEDRLQPLIDEQLLEDVECDSVDLETEDGSLAFTVLPTRRGQPTDVEPVELEIGTP